MKRAIFIIGFMFGSFALSAQVHGPAPSVNSFTGKSLSVGPAPSVNSVGPRGWQTGRCNVAGCINPFFTPTINFQTGSVDFGRQFNLGTGRGRHHRNGNLVGGYVYSYGYPYPVYVPVEPEQAEDDQPDAPAPTIFERRSEVRPAPNPTPVGNEEDSRYGQHYLDQREVQQADVAPVADNHEMTPVQEQPPILLVYKDGREQEVHNYAIVGDTLYDLQTYVARKIKLADLDIKQTIEKNEQRGVEFSVPARLKPVG